MENENEYLEELMKKYRDISQSLLNRRRGRRITRYIKASRIQIR